MKENTAKVTGRAYHVHLANLDVRLEARPGGPGLTLA
jgi:hypothetical protein